MRILILGAGAVGGYFGGRLAEAGADATFFVRPARARLLASRGLRIDSPAGSLVRDVKSISDPGALAPFDLVLLTCKAYDLDASLNDIAHAVGPCTTILPLLNGLAHMEKIAARFPQARLWGGVARISAALDDDGAIRHADSFARIDFGARDGRADALADQLAELYAKTPVIAAHNPNILREMWDKLVFLATLAGMNTLMRALIADIMATPAGERLINQMLSECASVARAEGFDFDEARVAQHGDSLTKRAANMKSSMLHDIEHGAPTEGEHILGDLHARARQHGVSAPLLEIALTHVRAYEVRRARR
ncbi:ketopantoate reductase family protein [Methylocystis bryophila]|uniref:2-dehydropantoate 2-reductase n=1 Tax=Methylocystis bryophila TaxID=655015 RepID=A0A1W6MS68_9HYPH|nr:ketopantoate reductase family protein [Methylocystis bryophila]ARN80386.1 2-dehydropantoate 2-reductase [Methylocystis bryophila]BDV40382.1 2-dehydropantoate 2-reductase [Methylocystis bryophila]